MSSYLIRITKDTRLPDKLLLFTDEEDGFRFTLSNEQRMNEYLKHLILLNHYSGIGPLIKGFWRWNDDDTRDELDLVKATETPELEGEYDEYYKVLVKKTLQEVTRFTVRIK